MPRRFGFDTERGLWKNIVGVQGRDPWDIVTLSKVTYHGIKNHIIRVENVTGSKFVPVPPNRNCRLYVRDLRHSIKHVSDAVDNESTLVDHLTHTIESENMDFCHVVVGGEMFGE
jgi:hypothetical protein